MLVVFSASHTDIGRTQQLLGWCAELGSYPQHRALIVCSFRLTREDALALANQARSCGFSSVQVVKQTVEEERPWPVCCNALFRVGLDYCKQTQPGGWFWMESDQIPLGSDWLDQLENEYHSHRMPFLGAIYDKPFRHLNGSCVYPDYVSRYNPYIQGAVHKPWDLIHPELTLRAAFNSPLMQRSVAEPANNTPHSFPDIKSLALIRPGVILFHGCKDGTLIARMREVRDQSAMDQAQAHVAAKPGGKSRLRGLLRYRFARKHKTKCLIVRRSGAFGDAIAATCIAIKLKGLGFDTIFQANPILHDVLGLCPDIKQVTGTEALPDVNLDGAYEKHVLRAKKPFWELYVESANRQLPGGLSIDNALQCTPRLVMPAKHTRAVCGELEQYPRPWVMICPRSNSHANRTVPDHIWSRAASGIHGTCFWLGTTKAPEHIVDLGVRTMFRVGSVLSAADLLISVDSGPLHLGAALGLPCVALLQASSPELHLSDQRDYEILAPNGLFCLNCSQATCPLDGANPPCQHFAPENIAAAANRRLWTGNAQEVSAVVTAYQPKAETLNRCLYQLLPQVAEIVVASPSDGVIPDGMPIHPKIRYLKAALPSIGYGRTANFGVRHTACANVLLINDDVFLDPGAVEQLLKTLRSDAKIGMVGHLLYYPDGRRIQHGGTRRNSKDIGWGHIDHNRTYQTIRNVVEMENVTHASVLMRRKSFYEAGGYDERFFMYYEDNALCLAVRQAGWKIFYTPFARGIHQEHQTSDSLPKTTMTQAVRHSQKIFTQTWAPYFERNATCDGFTKLGTF